MKRFLFFTVLSVTGLAVAMPTAKELEKAQKEIGELTAGMETARVIEIFEKAETEASRYLLLRRVAELHVKEKKFDAAAADLMALYTFFPDIAPSVVVDEIQQIARGVNEKDAPGLLRLLRQSQALNRELRSKKPNRLVLAELRASVGQWQTASELLTEQGGAFAKALENEAVEVDLPATADFWWDYEPTLKVAGDAFKSHAALLYQYCLDDKLLKNPLKIELFRKRIEKMKPTEGSLLSLVEIKSLFAKRYMVIDLARGPMAQNYPVTFRGDVPTGGWTEEYKSSKIVLRRIKPGTFQMGDKGKSVEVTLTRSFYIGVFEVTQRQYELVMGETPSQLSKGDLRPVGNISWNMIRGDAAVHDWPTKATVASDSFMGRLRARTRLGFDLPTEAQWEYACRAGTTSTYNNGGGSEEDLKKLGRYRMNQSARAWGFEVQTDVEKHCPDNRGGYAERTTSVGSYLPNAWGLYDFHGNVLEWCLDRGGNLVGGVDPVGGASSQSTRVMKGGCWCEVAGGCRSAFRITFLRPSINYDSYGFRLCCSPCIESVRSQKERRP